MYAQIMVEFHRLLATYVQITNLQNPDPAVHFWSLQFWLNHLFGLYGLLKSSDHLHHVVGFFSNSLEFVWIDQDLVQVVRFVASYSWLPRVSEVVKLRWHALLASLGLPQG